MSSAGSGGQSGSTRFVPGFEALEDRTVPSGNVQLFLTNGTLYVSGDDQSNRIEVRGTGERSVVITALDADTTINGRAGPVAVSGITRDLFIRTHGGDDTLIVVGTRNRGTLNADTGDGNDYLGVSGTGNRGASILGTGAGDDTAVLHSAVFRRFVSLNTGTGDDQVVAAGIGAVNFGLTNPGGNDFFSNQGSTLVNPATPGFTAGIKPPSTTSPPAAPTDPSAPAAPTDTTAPTASVSTSATSPTRATSLAFAISFNEDVTGFDMADVMVSNGSVAGFTALDARTFTVQVSPQGQGPVSVSVGAGAATDAARNANTASNTASVTFDSVAPSVTASGLTTANTTPMLTGTAEAGSTVQVTVNNRTYTATVSGTTWTALVTDALPNGTFNVTATATDAAGNTATSAAATLRIDNTPPTINFSTNVTVPTSANEVVVTMTFSEDVTGFTDADISVGNAGTKSDFTTVTPNRVFSVKVTRTLDGNAVLTIPAGAAFDVANNQSEASNFSFLFDTVAPMVTVNATGSGSITGTATETAGASGIQKVEISIFNGMMYYSGPNGANGGFDSVAEVFQPTASTDSFATWNFNLMAPPGMYAVKAKGTDNAGNVTDPPVMQTVTLA